MGGASCRYKTRSPLPPDLDPDSSPALLILLCVVPAVTEGSALDSRLQEHFLRENHPFYRGLRKPGCGGGYGRRRTRVYPCRVAFQLAFVCFNDILLSFPADA